MRLADDLTQAELDHVLFRAVQARTDRFIGANSAAPAVSVAFVAWLRSREHLAPDILAGLLVDYPRHPSSVPLAAAEQRLRARLARMPRCAPHEAVLVGGMPIVNRVELRSHLADLVSGYACPVVVVEGERGFGRSHSWKLIRHVAEQLGPTRIKPIGLDLVGPVLANQTLPNLFAHLTRVLGIAVGPQPICDGVTDGALSALFVAEFLARVEAMPTPWPATPWIVFDHLDRHLAPEVKLFVAGLVDARLNGALHDCVIFLLGPDLKLPIKDPGRLARRERLTSFLDAEIDAAVRALNLLGANPLDGADLQGEVDALRGLCLRHAGADLASAVFEGLVDLRERVRA